MYMRRLGLGLKTKNTFRFLGENYRSCQMTLTALGQKNLPFLCRWTSYTYANEYMSPPALEGGNVEISGL